MASSTMAAAAAAIAAADADAGPFDLAALEAELRAAERALRSASGTTGADGEEADEEQHQRHQHQHQHQQHPSFLRPLSPSSCSSTSRCPSSAAGHSPRPEPRQAAATLQPPRQTQQGRQSQQHAQPAAASAGAPAAEVAAAGVRRLWQHQHQGAQEPRRPGGLRRQRQGRKDEDGPPPLPPECTFKPRINDYEKVTQRPRPSPGETLARLAMPRRKYFVVKEQMRAEREREEMAACTFQPSLCEGTQRRAARAAAAAAADDAPPLPLPDRLQQRQAEAERRRRARRLEREAAELRDCTFTPHISPAAAALVPPEVAAVPLHDRLGEVQRARRERLAALKARLEAEAEVQGGNGKRYRPVISALSEQLARAGWAVDGAAGGEGENDGVGSADAWGEGCSDDGTATAAATAVRDLQARLLREAQRREQQRMQRLWAHEQAQAAACPFAPRLSAGTRRLVEEDSRFAGLGFLERQALLDAEAARRRAEEEARLEAERARWFRPAITALGRQQEDEAPEERARRLSVEEAARREAARARRTEQFYAEVTTFQPALNPVSRALGRAAASVDDLVYDWRREQARGRAAAEAEARLQEECTFRPTLVAAQPPRGGGTARVRAGQAVGHQGDGDGDGDGDDDQHQQHHHRRRCRTAAGDAAQRESTRAGRARTRQAQEALERQAQEERARAELEACTFQPDTRASRRSFATAVGAAGGMGAEARPVIVRGLGSFLARRQQAERQQWERQRALGAAAGGR